MDHSFKQLLKLCKLGGLIAVGVKTGTGETKMESKNRGGSSAEFSRETTYFKKSTIRNLYTKNGCSMIFEMALPHEKNYYNYFWIFGIKDP